MASGPWWGLPAGQEDLEDIWRALGHQSPPLPHFLGAYPALPCCGILPTPPLGLLAQQVWFPGELPGLCCRPLLAPPPAGPVEEAPLPLPPSWRAKAACWAPAPGSPSRESTAALKAWLGRHRKNPYPTKGEKVLLALVSRMSLTQVSTWFANARRRLKKEPPRRPPDGAPASPARPPCPSPSRPPSPPEPEEEPPRKQAKIWCLAELAAPAAPPGLQS